MSDKPEQYKITSTQKIIKVGDSAGITLAAKDLKRIGAKPGDQVDIQYQLHLDQNPDAEVIAAAKEILKKYKQDFDNLAQR